MADNVLSQSKKIRSKLVQRFAGCKAFPVLIRSKFTVYVSFQASKRLIQCRDKQQFNTALRRGHLANVTNQDCLGFLFFSQYRGVAWDLPFREMTPSGSYSKLLPSC